LLHTWEKYEIHTNFWMELLTTRGHLQGMSTGGMLREIDRVNVKWFRIRCTVKILET